MGLPSPSAAGVLASHYVVIILVLIVISARIHLRINIQKQRLLLSDMLMIAAWCSAIATASFDVIFLKEGALDPEIDYTLINFVPKSTERFEYLLKLIWASSIPFFTTFYLCKASILTLYLQIFPIFMVKRRLALYCTMAYCCMAYITSLCLHLFICFPIQRNWTITDPENVCPSIYMATVFQVAWALHFFGSVVIFFLPFAVIYKLQMRTRMKIGLYSVLCLGIVDLAFSLTRFFTVQLGNQDDFRSITLIETWSALDANIGLLIACLPSLRPYLRHNLKSSTNDYGFYDSSRPSKPTPARRPEQNGFKEISDPRYELETIRRASYGPGMNEFEAGTRWSDDKKSSRSDIELVRVPDSKLVGVS